MWRISLAMRIACKNPPPLPFPPPNMHVATRAVLRSVYCQRSDSQTSRMGMAWSTLAASTLSLIAGDESADTRARAHTHTHTNPPPAPHSDTHYPAASVWRLDSDDCILVLTGGRHQPEHGSDSRPHTWLDVRGGCWGGALVIVGVREVKLNMQNERRRARARTHTRRARRLSTQKTDNTPFDNPPAS